MADFIRYTVEGRIAVLVIDRSPVNAFNWQALVELGEAVDALSANPEVRVVVVTSASHWAFSVGADIGEIGQLVQSQDAAGVQALIDLGQTIFNKIDNCNKPFIAAINGRCLGGGLELAMACHLRICGERARLSQPEINLGLIPGWGGTQRLQRIVGLAKATEMILTGDQITAQQALQLALVNRVVPDEEVMQQAKALAIKIAQQGAMATAAAMRAIGWGRDACMMEGLAAEQTQFALVAASADACEGIAAFLEKRLAE